MFRRRIFKDPQWEVSLESLECEMSRKAACLEQRGGVVGQVERRFPEVGRNRLYGSMWDFPFSARWVYIKHLNFGILCFQLDPSSGVISLHHSWCLLIYHSISQTPKQIIIAPCTMLNDGNTRGTASSVLMGSIVPWRSYSWNNYTYYKV